MIDVDTGVDDAAAMALAVRLHANLVGVSCVAGNVPIEQATDNTLRVLSFLDHSSVPVFRGASRPLAASYQDASHIHGGNGLGNASLPQSLAQEAEMTAPEAIVSMAQEYEGELVLVMVGPLTNLAIALSLRPEITHQIASVVIMGGAFFTSGNITETSEFNIYVDPDAANQVFSAPWNDIRVVGLDVSHQTALTARMWEAIPEDSHGAAKLVRMISERTFTERVRSGFFLHDPLALAVALDPALVSGERYSITVSTDVATRGQTTVTKGGKVLVATEVQAERFIRRFCDALDLPYVIDTRGLANAE
jgi:inosine-uridine nucleoside N-ribohydrolase